MKPIDDPSAAARKRLSDLSKDPCLNILTKSYDFILEQRNSMALKHKTLKQLKDVDIVLMVIEGLISMQAEEALNTPEGSS